LVLTCFVVVVVVVRTKADARSVFKNIILLKFNSILA